MAPKKKTTAAVGPSGAAPPAPARAGDRAGASGGGDRDRPHHPNTRSQAAGILRSGDGGRHAAVPKGGAVPSGGGAGTSKGRRSTSPTRVPRSPKLVHDKPRCDVEDPGHSRDKSPQRHSQGMQGQHAHHGAGEKSARPWNRDVTPSNVVRNPSSSCSSRLLLPPTRAEVLSRA